jgi:hypothetical protein
VTRLRRPAALVRPGSPQTRTRTTGRQVVVRSCCPPSPSPSASARSRSASAVPMARRCRLKCPDGIRIVLVEVPADHQLRSDPRSALHRDDGPHAASLRAPPKRASPVSPDPRHVRALPVSTRSAYSFSTICRLLSR